MFPASLATGPFSLRAGCDCCAVSVGARLNADGSLASDVVVAPSALRPAQRMSYDEADAALAAGTDADLAAFAEVRVAWQPPFVRVSHPRAPGRSSWAAVLIFAHSLSTVPVSWEHDLRCGHAKHVYAAY